MSTRISARITGAINLVTSKDLGSGSSPLPTVGTGAWPALIAEITGTTFTKSYITRFTIANPTGQVLKVSDGSLVDPHGDAMVFSNVAAVMVIQHSGDQTLIDSNLLIHSQNGSTIRFQTIGGGVSLAYLPGGASTSGGKDTMTITPTGNFTGTIVILGS